MINTYYCWTVDSAGIETNTLKIDAVNDYDAAIEYITQYEHNHTDYPVAAGLQTAEVYVKDKDNKVSEFLVHGERLYIASRIKDKNG